MTHIAPQKARGCTSSSRNASNGNQQHRKQQLRAGSTSSMGEITTLLALAALGALSTQDVCTDNRGYVWAAAQGISARLAVKYAHSHVPVHMISTNCSSTLSRGTK